MDTDTKTDTLTEMTGVILQSVPCYAVATEQTKIKDFVGFDLEVPSVMIIKVYREK